MWAGNSCAVDTTTDGFVVVWAGNSCAVDITTDAGRVASTNSFFSSRSTNYMIAQPRFALSKMFVAVSGAFKIGNVGVDS